MKIWLMRRQLVPGLVVRLTVIKAKTRPGIEAKPRLARIKCQCSITTPLKTSRLIFTRRLIILYHVLVMLLHEQFLCRGIGSWTLFSSYALLAQVVQQQLEVCD